jgi:Tfp pilus assembly protein PilV
MQPFSNKTKASPNRKGITVLEVLISIFVLSFGLLGVLSLFAAGKSLTSALRVQTESFIYYNQLYNNRNLNFLKTNTTYSRDTKSYQYIGDAVACTWCDGDSWAQSTQKFEASRKAGRTTQYDFAQLKLMFNPNPQVLAFDPCGLFRENQQTQPSDWHVTSKFFINYAPLGIVSPRVTRLNNSAPGSPPTLSEAEVRTLFTSIDSIEYDPPASKGGPPRNAFENGARRVSSDYTPALFVIVGSENTDEVWGGNGPVYSGYREVVGIFHKRLTQSPNPVANGVPYLGPDGCVFRSDSASTDSVCWTLTQPDPNLVPSFQGYNDGSPESVTRAADYLKPGKLMLVRVPGTASSVSQWTFQRILSSSRKGTVDDTVITPKWNIVTSPAQPDYDDDINTVLPTQTEPIVAFCFQGLVLVHERGKHDSDSD